MRSENNSSEEFSVALLIEDIREAKELSDSLREMGIFAHYYQDLDDLWISVNTHTPDLCIVDVKKMTQGTLSLKQHPQVLAKKLKCAFYYKDSTQVLLGTINEMDHFGLIRGDMSLADQLKSILKRRSQDLALNKEVRALNHRLDRLRKHSKKVSLDAQSSQEELNQYKKMEKLIRSFGSVQSHDGFKKRLLSFFNDWDDCIEFGVYELNSTRQKLVAPKGRAQKYKILPDLWLSTKNDQGIMDFAQEMAYEVAYGVMDENILASRIFGVESNPDLLIIGKYKKENLKKFNWDLLEQKINSEYRRVLAKENIQTTSKTHVKPMFESLQEMDDIQFHNSESQVKYVCVDFSDLVSFIKQSFTNRFSWKSFYQEFNSELSASLNGEFELSHMSVEHMIVGLDKRYADTDINRLKTFCHNFQFWRYFEDTSMIVTQDLTPKLSYITPSSVSLIRKMHDNSGGIMHNDSQDRMITAKPQLRRGRQIEV